MAPKATIYKAELQVSDLDRHYYASHSLTLAQHPSETEERVLIRLLAFAIFADERLVFTRGLSTTEEPDIWQHSLSGEIERWIEVGQPDARRLSKACGRADAVAVLSYGGSSAEHWWKKTAPELTRFDNLTVLNLPLEATRALAGWAARQLDVQCLIEGGQVWLSQDSRSLEITPVVWQGRFGE
ncbi:MAG: YaeQ family protein [Candidatus Sericytochromatia bacterium]